ncbi:hypothetical protein, partial [Slackia piriformis]|uniref:hypothetical protein n=1 Tax=Slackia piriformis TaxID=626934 RepID=UPI0023F27627
RGQDSCFRHRDFLHREHRVDCHRADQRYLAIERLTGRRLAMSGRRPVLFDVVLPFSFCGGCQGRAKICGEENRCGTIKQL